MAKAQGQFTIIDYNDAITLAGFINSNLSRTQMYNPDNGAYTPDWSKTNLVLTPSLFAAGDNTDIIADTAVQSVTWYEDNSATAITAGGNYALSGTKNHILTVKGNVMAGLPGKDFRCVVTYKDPTTELTISETMSISFSRVVNGSGITALDVTTPDGNIFKNGEVTSLTAKAQLWRGSVVDETNVTYQWYKLNASITTDQGGGVGWEKLSNASNKYAGVATDTLTVYGAVVDSYATFKCVAKDTDSASATYNETFENVASFVDMNDPITVEILSTGGAFFKNGIGASTMTAKVYRAGEEIDTAGAGSYSWSKYNAEGVLDASWTTKTGKTIEVGSEDVTKKATFVCDVEV